MPARVAYPKYVPGIKMSKTRVACPKHMPDFERLAYSYGKPLLLAWRKYGSRHVIPVQRGLHFVTRRFNFQLLILAS